MSDQFNTLAAERNRREHGYFRSRINAIKAWISSEGTSMVEVIALKVEMEEWLKDHICKTDIQVFSGSQPARDSSSKTF